jgi:hypothetical protein
MKKEICIHMNCFLNWQRKGGNKVSSSVLQWATAMASFVGVGPVFADLE